MDSIAFDIQNVPYCSSFFSLPYRRLVNTSFNVRGEPIVNTPTDAFNCFMGTELDKLVIGNCYLEKNSQDSSLKKDYTKEFELD